MQKLTLWRLLSFTIVPMFLLLILTVLSMPSAKAQENTTNITNPTFANGNANTSNFLNYTSSSYGLKIQYPSYLIKVESQNQSSGDLVKFISPRGTPPLEVRISGGHQVPQNMSLEQWDNETTKRLRQSLDNFSLIGSNSTTIAGSPAHWRVYTAKLPSSGVEIKFIQFLIIKDNKEYIITANTFPTDVSFYVPTLHKMINSFAFIPIVPNPAH